MTESTQSAEQKLPNILIVDDEPEIRQMISLCFQNSFRIACAENVEEACKKLVIESFDAIISDVMMPGEDGISFLGRVHDSWPEIPVILMTGHAQLQMAVEAIKKGAFDFVCKPFDFDHLRKIVMRAVNYRNLKRMEKNYRAELEETVARRTAELKQSMAELDFARTALQQAATDKSAFMSTISHEMRTPMNGVIGALELLTEEGVTGAASEYIVMARQSADNMMTLINQLLAFNAQGVHGDGALHHELIELPSTLQSIVTEQLPLFMRKGLALSLQLEDDLPHQIWTDREKLRRLFDILLGNALKFTGHGAVTLAVSRTFSAEEGDALVCTLTDSGVGIPEGMLERIFEPFVQGDCSLNRRHEGAGLGLAIARQNALLLDGRLRAEHVPVGGSRFIVTLKIKTP
ncbi:MAG: response regulator [Desulfuromonadaceae bacterium]|nr:response regulator [Desulfuromonadaceae bacterium]MDD2847813.1 response regulator [Desulfuromonadaceae bacterium]MDD4129642.1 response regulator [Desulfuromonadaceae bacterium]